VKAVVAVGATALACVGARADETITVCYNYGCASQAEVVFPERLLQQIHEYLAASGSPEYERRFLAEAVGRLYAWAGKQTPIHNDRGGNSADDGVEGRMDCIDHSTTTTRLLRMLEARGWLQFNKVLDPALRRRFVVSEHRSAVVEENATGHRYVIDSWFVDNGKPAVVMPLEEWMSGGGPDV
jgi:hypothetical protein